MALLSIRLPVFLTGGGVVFRARIQREPSEAARWASILNPLPSHKTGRYVVFFRAH